MWITCGFAATKEHYRFVIPNGVRASAARDLCTRPYKDSPLFKIALAPRRIVPQNNPIESFQ
jgi:hypothetical protein